MTHEHETPPLAERSSRITAAAWIALVVVAGTIFAGIFTVVHKPAGVPVLTPGQHKVVALNNS